MKIEIKISPDGLDLPKEIQKKIMRQKLNCSEFRYFRTSEGAL